VWAAGHGSGSHVSGVYFQSITGTKFQFVPYRGAGPAMQDLIAGQIDIIIDLSRNLIRIWVAKYEAGAFEDDIRAADLLQEYEAKNRLSDRVSATIALLHPS
jgi:hypothetical protein